MEELIERLEKATGPDADLDVACWAVLKGMKWEQRPDGHIRALVEQCYCCHPEPHPHWIGYGPKEKPHARDYAFGIPGYTASLDAALTLVPEGHRWLLDKRPYADLLDRPDGYRCQVYKQGYPYRSDSSDIPTAWAKSPAIALCIAALRARLP